MKRLLGLAALAVAAGPAWAQRIAADVDCTPTPRDLVYDCRIALKDARTGQPVSGAEISVGADMPSMPMAHNVRPVKAKAGSVPGAYEVRIQLEMFGEWALRLNVRGPARDVIVKKLDFREPPR
jgi:hypothetical protein